MTAGAAPVVNVQAAHVLTTIRAVADAFGAVLEPAWIARLAVASETASDSLMYGPERAVLIAQRRGSVLMDLGGPLAGFLFEPGPGAAERIEQARAGLCRLGVHESWEFSNDLASQPEPVQEE